MKTQTSALEFMNNFSSAGHTPATASAENTKAFANDFVRKMQGRPRVFLELTSDRVCGLTSARAFVSEFFIDSRLITISDLTYSEVSK